MGFSSCRKSKQRSSSFAYSLSLWLPHRWPHFAPNYSINPASIIPSSFTSHYLPNPNPIPVPARPESHLGLQKIYKNVDRIQISVISTLFFLFFPLHLLHFGNTFHASATLRRLRKTSVIIGVVTWSRVASECLFNGCVYKSATATATRPDRRF